jgi:hypothetical protein
MAAFAAASLTLLSGGTASSRIPWQNGEFKGVMVCAQLPGQPAVLRVPMDLTVTENTINFARPIVNRGQVIGNEMGKGSVDDDGNFNMASSGTENGMRYEGKYKGVIAADGSGTFTGTQSWSMGEVTRTRTCTGAFVKN